MTQFPIAGGCHCGAVRFLLHVPPAQVAHCHCSICRRLGMSFFQTCGVVRPEDLTLAQGADHLTDYDSSPDFRRQFCRTCGAPLFAFALSDRSVVYFAAASLDGGVHPGHSADAECHIHVGSKAVWEQIEGGFPQYEGSSAGAG